MSGNYHFSHVPFFFFAVYFKTVGRALAVEVMGVGGAGGLPGGGHSHAAWGRSERAAVICEMDIGSV